MGSTESRRLHGRFAGALFAEHDRSGRGRGVAVHLVPIGMKRAGAAAALKDRIGLRILIGKGVRRHAMMGE